ncbi:sensor histidine kinase [Pedobacter cryoconitis]|uniref:Histidine kinase n=1 Tax=Pedobacter cryoconitis TaxID=188932 RepID=A0A327SZ10_9SPHI|nr:histidine kinase [Pedobacter cryoconitis]RAJ33084.1 histidine kinase [Pedobacter cryoconitis]
MFKSYQLKWFFILSGILAISTQLLRKENSREIAYWEYFNYALQNYGVILIAWLPYGYFFNRKFSWLKNYTKNLLSIVVSIFLALGLSYVFFLVLPPDTINEKAIGFNNLSDFKIHFVASFFLGLICYVVFYSIYTNTALQQTKLENEILEQAHLRAQLISLQQQISPHFLFNSLSTLKTIAPDWATKNYIIQLASVYRYVLNFNEHHLTPLSDEINFIRSYLYIMNERFEDSLKIVINIKEEYLKLLIPSLSLQLLVENAIKHNTISAEKPLELTIITDDAQVLTVVNNFQPKKVPAEGTGTGLKNIRERYKLLANQSIQVLNENGKFSVTIPLLTK